MPMLMDAPVIVSTDSILIGAKRQRTQPSQFFHFAELVTAERRCVMSEPEGP